MKSISKLAPVVLQTIFGPLATQLGLLTQFIRRQGKLDAAEFDGSNNPRRRSSGRVQIGRFLGNTQPQVRTLSGPFAKGIVRFVFES